MYFRKTFKEKKFTFALISLFLTIISSLSLRRRYLKLGKQGHYSYSYLSFQRSTKANSKTMKCFARRCVPVTSPSS